MMLLGNFHGEFTGQLEIITENVCSALARHLLTAQRLEAECGGNAVVIRKLSSSWKRSIFW